jgi:DNA-binding MurR/RpiR family transcriptional regulator
MIRMRLPSLTPLEGKGAAVILADGISLETPLKSVAEASGVSEAMVVKVAKKLGFAGFREFRQGLVDYNAQDTAMQALEETFAILDLPAFERAADYLARAKHREFYGLGGSAQIAHDISHKFLRIGLRTQAFDDAHMKAMSASPLGPEDVAVAYSHSGATTAVLEAVELARRNGARTIAVSTYPDSPITRAVDVVFCSTAQNSPLLGENATAPSPNSTFSMRFSSLSPRATGPPPRPPSPA